MPGPRTTTHRRGSLAQRYSAATVAVALVLATAVAVVSAFDDARLSQQRTVDNVALIVRGTAAPALHAAYMVDRDLALTVVEAVAAAPGVVSATLTDADGRVLAAAAGQAPAPRARPPLSLPPTTVVQALVAPASASMVGGPEFGALVVEVDPARAGVRPTDAFLRSLVWLAGLVGMVAAALYLVFDRLVARRLRRLTDAVDAMDPARPDVARISALRRDDEIGYLADRLSGAFAEAGAAVSEAWAAREAARAAEAAAAREARRFQDLVDLPIQGIMVHRDFRLVFVNPACARIYGAPSPEALLRHGDLTRFILPETRDAARAAYDRAMRTGRPNAYEQLENIAADGRHVFVDMVEQPIDWDGEPAMMCVLVDVTDRRAAEIEARETSRRLDLALRAARVAVFDADLATGACWWSPEFAEMLGYPRARLNDPGFWISVLHPDDRDGVLRATEEFLESGTEPRHTVEYRVIDAAGEPRWLLAQSQAVRDGSGRAVRQVGVMVDIDERRRAVEAVERVSREAAETARRLDLALDAARAGVFDLDTRTGETVIGDGFARRLGYGEGAMLGGTSGWWLEAVEPEDRPEVEEAISRLVETEAEVERLEFRMQRADGQPVWLAMRARSDRDGQEDGRAARVIGVLMDIDARKKADIELAGYRDMLEDAVAERTEQLARTQTELAQSERLASLATMVAGLAHEVNTPLGVGVTAASTLSESLEALERRIADKALRRSDLDAFLDQVRSATGIVGANLQRAAGLIRRFKTVAVDQASGERRRIELRGYVEDVVGALSPSFKGRAVEVRVASGEPIEIDTDPGAIAQIVTNLVQNALLHAFPDDRAGRIDIDVGRDQDRVRIRFADDGVGMDEDVRARIFDVFFTTRRGTGGSGLGMSIVRSLVCEGLGGRIEVRSAPGQGTVFEMDFPAEGGAVREAA